MGAPKIDRTIAWQIRALLDLTKGDGTPLYTQVELASRYGLAQCTISAIKTFHRWPLTSTESTSVPDKRFAQPTKCPTCHTPLICDTDGQGNLVTYCPQSCEQAA